MANAADRTQRLRAAGASVAVIFCLAAAAAADDSGADLVVKPAGRPDANFVGGTAILAKLRIAMPDERRFEPLVRQAARANGLPETFLDRILRRESQYFAFAQSRAGAEGIAQFMPATASDRRLGDPYDVNAAIPAAAAYLGALRRQFGGDLDLAAAAYNAGPRVVREWRAGRRGLPRETLAYVRAVTGAELSAGGPAVAEAAHRPAKPTPSAWQLANDRRLNPESRLCAALSSSDHPCRVQNVY
jgi:soluble lytic murein transglycosylase-like protein